MRCPRIALAGVLLPLLFAPDGAAQTKPSRAMTAARFVEALNQGDLARMMALSSNPFLYRNQQWTSAAGGTGYVLGPASDQRPSGTRGRRTLFSSLVGKVRIQSVVPAEKPPSQPELRAQNLQGAAPGWAGLELFVFLRGFGDVEHVALVGVDKKGKVRGLYLN